MRCSIVGILEANHSRMTTQFHASPKTGAFSFAENQKLYFALKLSAMVVS